MNRLKSATRIPASIFLAPIIAAIIAASGGVIHAIYKNRQVQVNREIDAIERRIEQYQLDIRTTQMRSDFLLNRFVIRKQQLAFRQVDSNPMGQSPTLCDELTQGLSPD